MTISRPGVCERYETTPSPATRTSPPFVLLQNQVAHLRREIDRLSVELEDTETARAQSISAVEAERDAAIAREAELSEDLRNVQLAAERVACSGEDDVIAVEKAMRAKHEQEVAGLHDRASKADERVGHSSDVSTPWERT